MIKHTTKDKYGRLLEDNSYVKMTSESHRHLDGQKGTVIRVHSDESIVQIRLDSGEELRRVLASDLELTGSDLAATKFWEEHKGAQVHEDFRKALLRHERMHELMGSRVARLFDYPEGTSPARKECLLEMLFSTNS